MIKLERFLKIIFYILIIFIFIWLIDSCKNIFVEEAILQLQVNPYENETMKARIDTLGKGSNIIV